MKLSSIEFGYTLDDGTQWRVRFELEESPKMEANDHARFGRWLASAQRIGAGNRWQFSSTSGEASQLSPTRENARALIVAAQKAEREAEELEQSHAVATARWCSKHGAPWITAWGCQSKPMGCVPGDPPYGFQSEGRA